MCFQVNLVLRNLLFLLLWSVYLPLVGLIFVDVNASLGETES